MNKIIIGQQASFTVEVARDGVPTPISGALRAAVYTADGRRLIVAPWDLTEDARWQQGIVPVTMDAAQTQLVPAGEAILMLAGDFGARRFRLVAEGLTLGPRVSLFIEDLVVDEIRRDRLMAAAAGILQDIQISDAYIWDKVRAAEAEMAHTLRVPLVPTKFFPRPPTPEQIEAIDGIAWDVDPGYDYDPTLFRRDVWGYLVTQHRPLIEVEFMRLAYPSPEDNFFVVPADWLRVDNRAGHIRLVPTGVVPGMALSAFGLTAMVAGAVVPSMIQLSYTAGLRDAAATYPELLDAIKKKAVLKIVADAFLPQSGSISADGLSQSLSVDMSKYSEALDEIINGPKGSNGGLMTKIHGIRTVVV